LSGPLLDALGKLSSGRSLTEAEAHAAVGEVMLGEAPEAVLSAFLTALRMKGETPDELAGAVRAVRERMTGWDDDPASGRRPLLDTCGTGGDGANTVNISTATAIVVAAAGVAVAKHGNRSASGNSGSAEVLTELGVEIEATPEQMRRCLHELGLTFFYAPKYHPALRHAAAVRRQLPFRTLFNLVGPLANPARPEYQIVGVSGERQAVLVAETLLRLGTLRAAVVRGADGLDEVTLGGATHVLWVEFGTISSRTWTPEDFGLATVTASELRVTGPSQSAAVIRTVLSGDVGPAGRAVLANAGAALLVVGRVDSLREGVDVAAEAIRSGRASGLLERWRGFRRQESTGEASFDRKA
jgi:anthranilate phosphoribosyltransferase